MNLFVFLLLGALVLCAIAACLNKNLLTSIRSEEHTSELQSPA